MKHSWYRWQGNTLILNVQVQPRSRKDEIVGPYGDALKVKITAPPVDGKANSYLCQYLAKVCAVSKSSVQLVAGDHSRKKTIYIDLDQQQLPESLMFFTKM
jgi:uncharacterized protein (TIGR00251 family)